MKLKVKRGIFKITKRKGKKKLYTLYPIAQRYEDGKLTAFSFMTELKGK